MLVKMNQVETFADWIRHPNVTENTDIAISFGDEKISYSELAKRSGQLANALLGFGVQPGDRVAILDKNSHRYFELLFACALIRATPVGINWRLAPPEVAYALNDSRAPVLFCGDPFKGLIDSIRGGLEYVKTTIAIDFEHPEWLHYETLRDAESDDSPDCRTEPDDTLIQLYTSGTTGYPKGAEITHRNVLGTFDILRFRDGFGWYDWQQREVNLVCTPMFHISGISMTLLGLCAGTNNLLHVDVSIPAILETIEQDRVNIAGFVPAIILLLMQAPEAAKTDLSSVRQVIYGASPIPEDLLKQAMAKFDCDFVQVYGMTETFGSTSHLSPSDHRKGGDLLRSCGRPNRDVDVEIHDAEGRALPQGEIGEIVTRGIGIMKGYWNAPEKTAETIRNGWLHTGDVGFFDADGYLYVHDRIKDMIVSGGENVYPAEVENALFSHPDIADVAIVSIPDEKWGETVHAVVVMAGGKEPMELLELQNYAREHLAGYKVPRSMEIAEMLPRNPSGKILRRELREKYWKGRSRAVN